MSPDQAGFKKALKENPYDEVAHRAYADWLDENGFEQESLIHREWDVDRHLDSQYWLEGFVRKINEACNRHQEEENEYDMVVPPYYRDLITYDQLLEAAGKCLEGDYRGGFTLPFDIPGIIYRDRKEFWQHVSRVLWVVIPNGEEIPLPFRFVRQ